MSRAASNEPCLPLIARRPGQTGFTRSNTTATLRLITWRANDWTTRPFVVEAVNHLLRVSASTAMAGGNSDTQEPNISPVVERFILHLRDLTRPMDAKTTAAVKRAGTLSQSNLAQSLAPR